MTCSSTSQWFTLAAKRRDRWCGEDNSIFVLRPVRYGVAFAISLVVDRNDDCTSTWSLLPYPAVYSMPFAHSFVLSSAFRSWFDPTVCSIGSSCHEKNTSTGMVVPLAANQDCHLTSKGIQSEDSPQPTGSHGPIWLFIILPCRRYFLFFSL